ncbi:MAG: HAMP domain-containing sensor histidine kinase [Patescibacteria group bacterium]|nr:HAMP domain-containing sensor histidine kinase [Patescibacteria group bacterium]
MKIKSFKECKDLKLGFFECPSSLFIFAGFITILLILTTFFIARNYYSEEIVFLMTVFIAMVMFIISYFVHQGTVKVADSKKNLQNINTKLKNTLEKLKKAEKQRTEFINMMVHDLRSPLNGLRMVSNLMIDDIKKDKVRHFEEPVKLVNQSSQRMLDIVNDLLDVSKIESGMFKAEKEVSDISYLIEDVIKYFKPVAGNKNISIKFKKSENLPQIPIDKKKMRQVFENLLSNAIKFTKKEGRIEIGAFLHKKKHDLNQEAEKNQIEWYLKGGDNKLDNYDQSLVISVTDNGQGISFKNLSKLFNKFEQMKNVSQKKEKGSGLGLVIVKGIVEAHGGNIGVASKKGVGTTFYFNLPLS